MYDIYSPKFADPIYNRLMKKPWEEQYSHDDVVNGRRSPVQKDYFIVPHEKVPGLKPSNVNILYSLRCMLINNYKDYNKLEFDAPRIHHVVLKV